MNRVVEMYGAGENQFFSYAIDLDISRRVLFIENCHRRFSHISFDEF